MKNFKYKSLKGMYDCFSQDIYFYQYIEKVFKKLMINYCFDEIRFPILENTSIFKDICRNNNLVKKEMYSFDDRNGLNISLRPEGTICCTRLCLENNLFFKNLFLKLWYMGPMFRYENSQKGRFRQFNQIGVEVFGLKDINIDLELLLILKRLFNILGVYDFLNLEINFIGNIQERESYINYLFEYITKKNVKLIIDKHIINPLKLINSNDIKIKKFFADSLTIKDFLSKKSLFIFNLLCAKLDFFGFKYVINYNLMRGLDYYNDLVFEWKSNLFDFNKTVCAGGRYDNLVSYISNFNYPAVGFAIGLERLGILFNLSKKKDFILYNKIDIYIISSFNDETKTLGVSILEMLLDYSGNTLNVYNDYICKNINNKIKKVLNMNVRILIIIGEIELNNDFITLKDLYENKLFKLSKNDINNVVSSIFSF